VKTMTAFSLQKWSLTHFVPAGHSVWTACGKKEDRKKKNVYKYICYCAFVVQTIEYCHNLFMLV
jgi:hypothetical protein